MSLVCVCVVSQGARKEKMHFFLTLDLKPLVIWRRDGEYVVVHMTLCFFLFSKYYHQSYWPSMVYVQPVLPPSPVEVYPAYAEPAPVLDQSVPQLYTDAGRTEVHQVPLETPANG